MQGTENTAVVDDQINDGPDEDFDAGFAGTDTPTATPEKTDPAQVKPEGETAAAATTDTPAPEYVQITKEELAGFKASAAAVEELKATLTQTSDKTFGKIGGIERLIKELQTSTPAGEAVELSDEDMAEFAEEYPELANMQKKVLNAALSKIKLRGTGTGESVTPEKIAEMVTQQMTPALERVREETARDIHATLLAKDHPDWKEIVDAGKPDSKVPYRTWLAAQPAEYQNQVNSAVDASVIGQSITKFKEHVKSQEAISKRQSRIDGAVTPKGAGGSTAPASTDDDDFESGFKTG